MGLLIGLALALPSAAMAQESAAGRPVRLIRIPLPISGTVDQQIRQLIERVLEEFPPAAPGPTRPILVLEFRGAAGETAVSSQFERCLALARYLSGRDLAGVETVAYVPQTLKGHAVLVVLACEQIIMHPDAELGEAAIAEPSIDPTVLRGYREVAERRGSLPAPLALGLLDPRLEVVRVITAGESGGGDRYVLAEDLDELQQQGIVQRIDTVIAAGQPGLLTGRQLRHELRLIGHLAENRAQLAAALGVTPDQLVQDPSLGRGWKAVQVQMHGPITRRLAERVRRSIDEGIAREKANLVFLDIDSPGGEPQASLELATYLVRLDAAQVRSVAYIRRAARGDAALVAWACDQLVMDDQAVLGGDGAYAFSEQDLEDVQVALQSLARERERSWSLAAALIDPQLEIHRYALDGSGATALLSPEELADQGQPERWQSQETIHPAGNPLSLDADRAKRLEVARFVIHNPDELATLYQLADSPQLIQSRWAYELIDALARREVAAGLLFLGGFALIAELSSPGIGIGGFLSAVCFILYFWSNFLHGTAVWLEVILFVTGLAFLALEIFVLPGMGVFGVGGAVLMLAALVLASQTFIIPRNAYQLEQFPRSIAVVSAAVFGIVGGGFVMRRYLAQTPVLRHLVLDAPTPSVVGDAPAGLYDDLVGEVGIADTPLRPAGKVRFGARVVDVISDGSLIDAGQPVQVESVIGNRVVVVPLEGGTAPRA